MGNNNGSWVAEAIIRGMRKAKSNESNNNILRFTHDKAKHFIY